LKEGSQFAYLPAKKLTRNLRLLKHTLFYQHLGNPALPKPYGLKRVNY
jgi:hypothetical protein